MACGKVSCHGVDTISERVGNVGVLVLNQTVNVGIQLFHQTGELCIQVTQALRTFAEHLDIEIVAVFGGAPIRSQQSQLRSGAHVVVATVGRMKDQMSRGSLVLTAARYVVLDEADEMLDLGFIEDVEKILRMCPSGRQTGLFSATMPPPIATPSAMTIRIGYPNHSRPTITGSPPMGS